MGYLTNNYELLPVSFQFVPQISTHTVPRGTHCGEGDVLRDTEHQNWALRGSGPRRDLYTLICASAPQLEHWLQDRVTINRGQEGRGHWPPGHSQRWSQQCCPGSGCARTHWQLPAHGDGLLGHPTLHPRVMFDKWLSSIEIVRQAPCACALVWTYH